MRPGTRGRSRKPRAQWLEEGRQLHHRAKATRHLLAMPEAERAALIRMPVVRIQQRQDLGTDASARNTKG